MNQEMLCTWLGLPKTAWPPDPWALLGLTQGDHDLATIEERVHDRMKKLRTYQLSFPEEATEGMNRLAEAFITLTETCSKKQAVEASAAPKQAVVISKDETSVLDKTKSDWRDEPPPVRDEVSSVPELIVEDETAVDDVPVSRPFAAPSMPHRRLIDPAYARELAEESDEATSNVGTLDAVIERVETTRRLLYAWEKVGRYLKASGKKPSAKECEQFARRLQAIGDAMKTYPTFLGQAGKPGYRVVVQARLKIPLATVRAMAPEQREELLGDWQDGYQVLLAHRKYLRQLFKSMRHRSAAGLVVFAVRAALNDYPRLTLIGMVLVVVVGLIGAAALSFR